MSRQIVALVDCASFYVSVERSLNASLQGRPAVVLSNNDGNLVAVCATAKRLGLKRGMAYFQCRSLIEQHGVAVFSSNYSLYQNMSDRVMRVVAEFAEERGGVRQQECYSIDESFISLAHVAPEHLLDVSRAMQARVLAATGIPVRVGIGPSKVLSKIAASVAKREPGHGDVVSLVDVPEPEMDALMATIAVEEVWGIGKKWAARLEREGISTAALLKGMSLSRLRKLLGVVGMRIALELRGVPCLPLELFPKPKKIIFVSRSFGRSVTSRKELAEAVSHYAARAAKKLRSQDSVAGSLSIYVSTNTFDKERVHYARGASKRFQFPTNFTPDLIETAQVLLSEIYRPGVKYKRAGVSLSDIRPNDVQQPDLFSGYSLEREVKKAALMAAVDVINAVLGRDVLFFAAEGLSRDWEAKAQWLSPRSTTRWSELLQV